MNSKPSNQKTIKAMILAAGRGKRLRPITDTTPKPLVPLCGKPLIEYHIEKLAKAGVREIVINHAWLGDKIEQQLGDGSRWNVRIHYSPEPEGGLETAGGIINALPLLGEQPFLLLNGDVYCEMEFDSLVDIAQNLVAANDTNLETDKRQQYQSLGHLVLVPSPEHNSKGDFGLDENFLVEPQGELTFAGLSVLSPKLFDGMSVDFIPLAPILRQAMENGLLSGEVQYSLWSDVGTLERLHETERWIAQD
ncbi:mannose-1-phosphate guanylyltransferase [Thiomicrorhabdus immobilis]|uniref:Mannose-1-phosphate guanylyltransferase n=1 Tax=Thiomicrorhabdus immobilis TaxID=2791037 RepID=A0ABN6CV41_9GAMM|nr:nucleotidyltransferase family protein [Thiomicrorhabdus immobilis]BCN92856.1 mannose-1-phosphate guanylyltransferase [Thiomicrorhabdus immobilis]